MGIDLANGEPFTIDLPDLPQMGPELLNYDFYSPLQDYDFYSPLQDYDFYSPLQDSELGAQGGETGDGLDDLSEGDDSNSTTSSNATRDDGLDDLFEGGDGKLMTPSSKATDQSIDELFILSVNTFDGSAKDASGRATQEQRLPGSATAVEPPRESNFADDAPQRAHVDTTEDWSKSFKSASHQSANIPDEVRPPLNEIHTMNGSNSHARLFDPDYPSAPAFLSREVNNQSYRFEVSSNAYVIKHGYQAFQAAPDPHHTTALAHVSNPLAPSNSPDNFVRQPPANTRLRLVDSCGDGPDAVLPQATQPAIPGQQDSQGPRSWKPFTNIREGRMWLLGAQKGPCQTFFQDTTIPQTPKQKRAIAEKLRAAFELGQPPQNEVDFLLLDWTCLELVEEVLIRHRYGPLTERYHSGMRKDGAASVKSFSDHIDVLVAAIGKRGCEVDNLRESAMDITHRHRLIDNPMGELRLKEKYKLANEARNLREEQRKAENVSIMAKVQSQSMKRPRAAPDARLDKESNGQQPISARRILEFRQPSSKVSNTQKSNVMHELFRSAPYKTSPVAGYSSSSFSERSPLIPTGFRQSRHGQMLIETQGPSATKKIRYTDQSLLANPQTPTPKSSSAVASRRPNNRDHLLPPQHTIEAIREDALQASHDQGSSQANHDRNFQETQKRHVPASDLVQNASIIPPHQVDALGIGSNPITTTIPISQDMSFSPTTLPLPKDRSQAIAMLKRNYAIMLSSLTAEQLAEAEQFKLNAREYAHLVTLEMHGLRGAAEEFYGSHVRKPGSG